MVPLELSVTRNAHVNTQNLCNTCSPLNAVFYLDLLPSRDKPGTIIGEQARLRWD